VGIHHLKLAPGKWQISSEHGKIVDMRPLRRDHDTGLQRKQIANAKIAYRHPYIEFHRELCNAPFDAKWCCLFTRIRLSRNKSDASLPFRAARRGLLRGRRQSRISGHAPIPSMDLTTAGTV
jgi:hypothetical protein